VLKEEVTAIGRVADSPGGVGARDVDGAVVRTVSVSGDRPDDGGARAVFGVESVGLVAAAG
jgi:hypothetical protein